MRSKAPLALMEQIVMVLVFALAAALCMETFVLSDRISRAGAEQDRALVLAQSAAEICKSSRFDSERLISHLGGQVSQGRFYVNYGPDWSDQPAGISDAYRLNIQELPSDTPGLRQAVVWVTANDSASDRTLARLTVAWQEVVGNE